MKNDKLIDALSCSGITPVLMDIGASGWDHKVWGPIKSESILLAFDPDLREMGENIPGYKKSYVINKAIGPQKGELDFYLTKFPFCSSLFEPDLKAITPFIYSPYFEVEQKVNILCVTIPDVMEQVNLEHLDWLKIDSQGADLHILKSLPQNVLSDLVVVETELGLTSTYFNEHLFAHQDLFMREQGFWLSDFNFQSYPRISREQFTKISKNNNKITEALINSTFKRTPTAAEARYFNSIENLLNTKNPSRSLIIAFVFGFLDEQIGYCLEALDALRKIGFDESNIIKMNKIIDSSIEKKAIANLQKNTKRDFAKKVIKKILGY